MVQASGIQRGQAPHAEMMRLTTSRRSGCGSQSMTFRCGADTCGGVNGARLGTVEPGTGCRRGAALSMRLFLRHHESLGSRGAAFSSVTLAQTLWPLPRLVLV